MRNLKATFNLGPDPAPLGAVTKLFTSEGLGLVS